MEKLNLNINCLIKPSTTVSNEMELCIDVADVPAAHAMIETINSTAELLAMLKDVSFDLAYGTTNRWKGKGSDPIFALIRRLEGSK